MEVKERREGASIAMAHSDKRERTRTEKGHGKRWNLKASALYVCAVNLHIKDWGWEVSIELSWSCMELASSLHTCQTELSFPELQIPVRPASLAHAILDLKDREEEPNTATMPD